MIPKLPSGFTHPLLIGEGAFSSVYRVRQTSLDRWVAIKIISEINAIRRKEILKEAKTQAKIQLECIPQVYDTFEWKNKICIVMQWHKGVSLKAIMDSNPPFNHRYKIANSLISAVSDFHRLGFAHRDIKPENILVSPEHGVILVDLGFTKNISDNNDSINGVVKGTPAYMAPEIWNSGKDVNYLQSDLFSLGKILAEIFANEDNFQEAINSLLNIIPEKRPETACEFQKIWKSIDVSIKEFSNWGSIAGNLSHTYHSRKLLTASKDLLYAHRHEESYWLLVECLEEDPDYDEAIAFMRNFPHSSRKNFTRNLLFTGTFFFLIVVSACAYLLGKHSGDPYDIPKLNNFSHVKKSDQLVNLGKKQKFSSSIKLFEDTLKSVSFSGRLVVHQYPQDGFLLIDSITIRNKAHYKSGIECQKGLHQLAWKNRTGRIVWRQKLFLLPFQTKQISIKEGS